MTESGMNKETEELAGQILINVDDIPILDSLCERALKLERSQLVQIIQFLTGSISVLRKENYPSIDK